MIISMFANRRKYFRLKGGPPFHLAAASIDFLVGGTAISWFTARLVGATASENVIGLRERTWRPLVFTNSLQRVKELAFKGLKNLPSQG